MLHTYVSLRSTYQSSERGGSNKKLQSRQKTQWLKKLQHWPMVQPDQYVSCYCFDVRMADIVVAGKPSMNLYQKATNMQHSSHGRLKVTGSSSKKLKLCR